MALRKLAIAGVLIVTTPVNAQPANCPVLVEGTIELAKGASVKAWKYRAKDGTTALIVGRGMNVNADGAKNAYAAYGQHGLSYLCDGASVSRDGVSYSYDDRELCAAAVEEIDRLKIQDGKIDFPATMAHKFCIFGFSISGGDKCHDGNAVLVGAGKAASASVRMDIKHARGAPMPYFYSTTAKTHDNGQALDATVVPFVVAARGMTSMRQGDFAYVVSDGSGSLDGEMLVPRKVPVMVGDVGPADKFGEGSIALHQYLAYGTTKPAPGFDPEVCKGKDPRICSISERYILPVTFPYPYMDKKGGDVRAKRNWPSTLMYVLFPDQQAWEPKAYTFTMSKDGKSEGTIVDGATKAAAAFGGIDAIVDCVTRQKTFSGLTK